MFFFSSRRRHTRSLRDWSSDVCSSDLSFGWRRGSMTSTISRRLVVAGAVLALGACMKNPSTASNATGNETKPAATAKDRERGGEGKRVEHGSGGDGKK